MKYEVVSDRPCLIDAIGEMKPGETVELTEFDVQYFEAIHGHKLASARFPDYVHITVILGGEE